MSSNPDPSQSDKLNVIVSLVNRLRLVARLLRDSRVPFLLKLMPFASLLYVLMPIDVIPDMLPVLGQLDDLGVVILAVEAFIMMCPQAVVDEHKASIAAGAPGTKDNVIDGEWHSVNRDRR